MADEETPEAAPEAAEEQTAQSQDYSYEQLHGMTVAQLREIASGIEHEAVAGYTQLNKDHLLPKLCEALGIEAHEHHEVVGIDKRPIKAQLKKLKAERLEAIDAKDSSRLKSIRKEKKLLKRRLKRAMV